MRLLIVTLYEFGQFLQILLWISLPMAVVAILITTYLHYRKKRAEVLVPAAVDEEERAGESWPEDSNHPYQGYLWMKDKYEEYRQQADDRYYQLKAQLSGEQVRVKELNTTIGDLNNTITDLSARLEANRRLLLNIHNELNNSLKGESLPPLPAPPAEPIPELPALSAEPPAPAESAESIPPIAGEGTRIVGWVESGY